MIFNGIIKAVIRSLFPPKLIVGDVLIFDEFGAVNPFTGRPPHKVVIKGIKNGFVNYAWLDSAFLQNESMSIGSFCFCYKHISPKSTEELMSKKDELIEALTSQLEEKKTECENLKGWMEEIKTKLYRAEFDLKIANGEIERLSKHSKVYEKCFTATEEIKGILEAMDYEDGRHEHEDDGYAD